MLGSIGKLKSYKVLEIVQSEFYLEASKMMKYIAGPNDYIFLKTVSIDKPMPKIKFEDDPTGKEELLLYGYFQYYADKDTIGNKLGDDPLDFVGKGMRWTKAGSCVISTVVGNCIYHGCQSDAGFSGAPLIKRHSGDEIVIVGIHISAVTTDPVCGMDVVDGKGNLGIKISPDIKQRQLDAKF